MGIKGKIISVISMICLAVVLFIVGVWAATELDFKVSGNIEYTVPTLDDSSYPTLVFSVTNSSTRTVSVEANLSNSPTGDLVIPSKVRISGVEYSVTSITACDRDDGEGGFYNCMDLNSVTIPDSITSIGEAAFWACSMESVIIGKGVTSIPYETFGDCSQLISVTIGSGVASIGDYAFSGCSKLATMTVEDIIKISLGLGCFFCSLNIHSFLTSFGKSLFFMGEGGVLK